MEPQQPVAALNVTRGCFKCPRRTTPTSPASTVAPSAACIPATSSSKQCSKPLLPRRCQQHPRPEQLSGMRDAVPGPAGVPHQPARAQAVGGGRCGPQVRAGHGPACGVSSALQSVPGPTVQVPEPAVQRDPTSCWRCRPTPKVQRFPRDRPSPPDLHPSPAAHSSAPRSCWAASAPGVLRAGWQPQRGGRAVAQGRADPACVRPAGRQQDVSGPSGSPRPWVGLLRLPSPSQTPGMQLLAQGGRRCARSTTPDQESVGMPGSEALCCAVLWETYGSRRGQVLGKPAVSLALRQGPAASGCQGLGLQGSEQAPGPRTELSSLGWSAVLLELRLQLQAVCFFTSLQCHVPGIPPLLDQQTGSLAVAPDCLQARATCNNLPGRS